MTLLSVCGLGFAILHLAVILATPFISRPRGIAAATLYLSALSLFWWAISSNAARPLSAVFSPDLPGHLVDRGPYRFIRHPFYCSYLLTWAAGIVATAQVWLLPTLVVMLLIYLRAAHMEERKFNRSPLAENYERYRSRTGLFFPNPVKLLGSQRQTARF